MTDTWTQPGHDYRTRLPQSILDAGLDPDGMPDPTSTDRRWLWRLEKFLSVSGTNSTHQQMASDLRFYLNETCGHHWRESERSGDIAAHRQCLWCCDVQWVSEDTP